MLDSYQTFINISNNRNRLKLSQISILVTHSSQDKECHLYMKLIMSKDML